MAAKDVRFSTEARESMLRGVEILADAVKATLGPRGRNVLIERGSGPPRISKDGVTVAREIELPDGLANMGARMVREVATRTSAEAGDGTTTATVLAQAIVREGTRAVAAGMNPMDLKRGIDTAVETVIADLRARSRTVSTAGEIAQVGTISANGESAIGELLARAMERVGHRGVITVEEAKGTATDLDVVEGLRFDRGYLSPYFITDPDAMTVELEDVRILLHEAALSGVQPLVPVLEAVMKAGSPLLIVAETVEGEALATLVVNRLRGGLTVCAVKAPGFGDRRRALLEDIAVVTGGQLVSEDLGVKLDSVTLDMLGRARRVRVDKETTTIIGGAGARDAIEVRCGQIRRLIDDAATTDADREALRERLGKLTGGVAVIRVGGASETEVTERRDRVDDAMHATRAAVEEGIVAGGGAALLYATRALGDLRPGNDDQRVGIDIVRRALEAPVRQIAANAGVDGSVIVGRMLAQDDTDYGYDAQANTYGDLVKAGIIDPTKVVRIALQDAASVAGLLITTEVMIAARPDRAPDAIDAAGMDF